METDSDVCINHALALVEGNTMEDVITRKEDTMDHWMNDGKAFFSEIFLAMMNKKRKPFPKYMFSYFGNVSGHSTICLLYTSPSPRDQRGSRMPSSA